MSEDHWLHIRMTRLSHQRGLLTEAEAVSRIRRDYPGQLTEVGARVLLHNANETLRAGQDFSTQRCGEWVKIR